MFFHVFPMFFHVFPYVFPCFSYVFPGFFHVFPRLLLHFPRVQHRSLLAAFGASGAVPADLVELGCPLSIEALRRRLLGRLLLGAEDVALEDAKRLKETR